MATEAKHTPGTVYHEGPGPMPTGWLIGAARDAQRSEHGGALLSLGIMLGQFYNKSLEYIADRMPGELNYFRDRLPETVAAIEAELKKLLAKAEG